MHKAHHIIVILLGIILFSYGALCFGEKIVIIGNHDHSPKVYMEDNKANGILIDIMKYVDQNSLHTFEYKLYPWKRAYENALNSKGGIIGLSMNSERLKTFDYSDVMFYDDLRLVVLKGHEFPFNNIKDLKGKIVGVQLGASYGEAFEKAKNSIFIVDGDKSGQQRLKKLLSKRIDVALISPGKMGLNSVIIQSPELLKRKDEFVILDKPFKRDPNFLGFKKTMNMEGFIQEFNKVLKKGHESGAIQKIIDNYGSINK